MAAIKITGRKQKGRLEWRKIRISYLAMKIWVVFMLVALLAAGGSVVVAKYSGKESFIGRFISVAGQKVNNRFKMLTAKDRKDEILEDRFASVSFYSGRVQVQRATDMRWSSASEKMQLAAGDRVRTFANARCDVSFDDGNVLRIKPNSLIVIGDMTENVRTKVKKSSVKLLVSNIEADIKKSVVKGSEFKLELPTAVAQVQKAKLSVSIGADKQSEVKVHTGTVNIDTGTERVQLNDRKKITISALKELTKPTTIISAPKLIHPKPMDRFYTNTEPVPMSFRWGKVKEGRSYRIDVATDRFFDDVIFTQAGLKKEEFKVPQLGGNVFFVRVAAVDARRNIGDFSDPVPFRIIVDRVAPYLEVQKFVVLKTARGREVLVNGQTEPTAVVEIGGRPVVVDENGFFTAVIKKLAPGQGELEIVVHDRAGNVKSFRKSIQT